MHYAIFSTYISISHNSHTHIYNIYIYILYHIFSCMFLYLTVGIDTTRVWWEPPSTSRDEAEAPHLCLVGHRQVPRCSPNHGIWEGDLWPVRFLLWFFVSSYFDQKEDLKWVMIFLPVGQLWSKNDLNLRHSFFLLGRLGSWPALLGEEPASIGDDFNIFQHVEEFFDSWHFSH